MFRTAFQQYYFQMWKKRRNYSKKAAHPYSVHHNRFVCLNASPASGQKNSPPTIYCLNCGCQRNKQMLLGNDCCSTHTVGTSQKNGNNCSTFIKYHGGPPRPNVTASPFRPPLAKKNMNRVFYTYAAALYVRHSSGNKTQNK